jgi:ABC-type spermidine/putrescine transport system permease subunit II
MSRIEQFTISRLHLLQLFAIVILGVVEQDGFYYLPPEGSNATACVFGQTLENFTGNIKACNYSLSVGVLALIAACVLTAIDIGESVVRRENETTKRLVVIADMIASIIMAFLALFAFAFLTELWTKNEKTGYPMPRTSETSAGATIVFFFLSTIVWVVLVVVDAVRTRSLSGRAGEVKYDTL